jgi:hypothetical protein
MNGWVEEQDCGCVTRGNRKIRKVGWVDRYGREQNRVY